MLLFFKNKIKPSYRTLLTQIDRIAEKTIEITVSWLFALLLIVLVLLLLEKISITLSAGWLQDCIKYSGIVLLIIFLTGVVARLVLTPFIDTTEPASTLNLSECSPLKNLTAEQEKTIVQMLKNLPAHSAKPEYINLAIVAHFLTALRQMNCLDDSNRNSLRIWIGQTTGKKMPSVSQFNEAYPSKTVTKINKEKERIEEQLKKIR